MGDEKFPEDAFLDRRLRPGEESDRNHFGQTEDIPQDSEDHHEVETPVFRS